MRSSSFLENDVKLGIADDSLVNTRLGCRLSAHNKIVIAVEVPRTGAAVRRYGTHAVVIAR